jgi:hypothetical protein
MLTRLWNAISYEFAMCGRVRSCAVIEVVIDGDGDGGVVAETATTTATATTSAAWMTALASVRLDGDGNGDVDGDVDMGLGCGGSGAGVGAGAGAGAVQLQIQVEEYGTVTSLAVPTAATIADVRLAYIRAVSVPGMAAEASAARLMVWHRGERLNDSQAVGAARYFHVTRIVSLDDVVDALPRFNCPHCALPSPLQITLLCPECASRMFETRTHREEDLRKLTWRQLAHDVTGGCMICHIEELDAETAARAPRIALMCCAKQESGYKCPASSLCPRTPGGGGKLPLDRTCVGTATQSLEAALCEAVAFMYAYPASAGHRVHAPRRPWTRT